MAALPGVAFGTALVCLDWERALALVVLISPLALLGRPSRLLHASCRNRYVLLQNRSKKIAFITAYWNPGGAQLDSCALLLAAIEQWRFYLDGEC